MREIKTEVEISASREKIWDALIDLAAYAEWNPFIKKAEGEVTIGGKLKLLVKPPGALGMTIKPKVVEAEPWRRLTWTGRVLVPGIIDGEHYFILEDCAKASPGSCKGSVSRAAWLR